MPLDNTITSPGYNSYVDLSEINALISELSVCTNVALWDALSDIDKENLTIKATDNLNSFEYCGSLNNSVVSPNNMAWPRSGVTYSNSVAISPTEIPTFVKKYVASRNLEILNFGPEAANALTIPNNIKKQKLGGLEQEFFGPKEMTANTLNLNDFISYETVKPYVKNNRAGNSIVLMRA